MVRVIYIASQARSGSTLFERLLTSLPGFFGVGELRYIWERGVAQNLLCGCGSSFNSCAFWSSVLRTYPLRSHDYNQICFNHKRIDSSFNLFYKYVNTRDYSVKYNLYKNRLRDLYTTISQYVGNDFIVDGSKSPGYLKILQDIEEIDLHIVHLVRDPRGVCYSLLKKNKIRPEFSKKNIYMDSKSITKSSLEWLIINSFYSYNLDNSFFLKYEDFVSGAEESFEFFFKFLNVKFDGFSFNNGVDLEPSHSVSGNPMRFHKGKLLIKNDTDWKFHLNSLQQLKVKSICYPLMKKYKYI